MYFEYFTHGIQLSHAQNVILFPFVPSRPLCRSCSLLRGVWYEHDVTSDDEAEENQEPIAEDQHDEESGDEDDLEDSYDETD